MNEFFKYQKIYESVDNYTLNKKQLKMLNLKKTEWIVQEKVHGSNFSIYFDGNKIEFAKRNSILQENEWFYNYETIKSKLILNTNQLYKLLNKTKIIIYGELFGGFYPPDPKNWINNRIDEKGNCKLCFDDKAIQEGIYYSNNIEYMVFDVAYINDNNDLIFVDYYDLCNSIKNTNFFFPKELFIGSFQEIQNFNLNFNSTIPKQLGYEDLPKNSNLSEGIIIKPIKTININTKSNQIIRCIIKRKNDKFKEISDNFNMEEAIKSYKYTFSKMLNTNRLAAVLSKYGKLTQENCQKITELLMQDIWEDYYLNYNYPIHSYDDANNYLQDICKNFIDKKN